MSNNPSKNGTGIKAVCRDQVPASNGIQIASWMRKILPEPQVVQLFAKRVRIEGLSLPTNLVGYFDDLDALGKEAHRA